MLKNLHLTNPTLVPWILRITCFFPAILVTSLLIFFYRVRVPELRRQAEKQREIQAQQFVAKLNEQVATAKQVSNTAVRILAPLRNDRAQVIDILNKLLSSTDEDLIHGIGLWFEPYQFDTEEQYFGPYLYRDLRDRDRFILTDEWTVAEYDFHRQNWYLLGKDNPHQPQFTEPYFDTNLIYISLSQGFEQPDSTTVAGVVTVDMTLPLLQSQIDALKVDEREFFYITTASNRVFLHPDHKVILTTFQARRPEVEVILDISIQELKEFHQQQYPDFLETAQMTVPDLGWQVHVFTQQGYLLTEVTQLRRTLLIQGLGIWTITLIVFMILNYTTFNQYEVQRLKSYSQTLEAEVAKRAAQLKEKEEFLHRVIDTTPNVIFVKDTSRRFILGNQALAEVYNTTVQELVGKTDADFKIATPTELEQFHQADQWVLQHRQMRIFEEFVTLANGETRCFLSIKTPLILSETQAPYLLGVATDITERKRIEAEMQHAREAADSANQAKSEFLANMSHELRTPLNGILGYAQILRRMDNLTAKQRHGVEVIQQAGTHLLNLINDVLDLAKVEARRLELVPQTVNLLALLNSITEVIRIKAEEKGLEFFAILDPNLPTGVFIDPKRLRQVLLNLLGNATKFTQHGAISLTVDCLGSSISTPMLDAEVMPIRFTVQDTGVGMTSEQVAKIFLPFEQVGKQAQRAEGTGLGLAISRQLVELMGGKLQVSSQLGEGSRFWFEVNLPIVQAWQDELTVSAEGKIIGYQGERRKILVVDDKAVNRLVVREVLEPLGFEIAEAEDGCQGLRQYEQFQPDLIVTDLVMPEMDGFELAREIRIGGDQQVIIIASSASVLAQDQDQSIIAGCNDFVPKPVEMELLLARIQKYLNLEWIYVQVAQEEESSNIQELIYPPPSELENLRHLAQLGDILGIRREVQRIRELDATYQVFCDRVLALAQEFDDAGILDFLSDQSPH